MAGLSGIRASLVIALSFVVGAVHAQDFSAPYPMFRDDAPLELRISAPFRALERDEGDDRPEYAAVIEYIDADGTGVELDIEIRIRGRSRLENCDFPPLSLGFRRDRVGGTVFEGQNRLKLVTLCKRGGVYVDYLTQEFQIYRMFNVLTNRSFQVRWANVEYVYTDAGRERSKIEPAFLLEEDWAVAERLGMDVIEIDTIEIDELDAQYTALYSLFQFLVGNTDWAVLGGPSGDPCCHNGKVIGTSGWPYVILPYDFDNAGLISAEYAVPSDILPIRSVRQRLYRGFCLMNEELDAAALHIMQRRERLAAVLDDETLSRRSRDRAEAYFNEFFEIISDAEERQEQIDERCRN
jgi:hypothetical protein